MRDPFKIEGPAVISFSGGRTSGYMLWRILQAHQWILPDDVKVIFANTGKEMPETLDFVRDCSVHWNVPVVWVEYAGKRCCSTCHGEGWTEDIPSIIEGRHCAKCNGSGKEGEKQIRVVNWDTASRNGEPYEQIIKDRQYLPNPVARFCTVELKVRPMHQLIKSWGWDEWTACIGTRGDEPRRVAKLSNHYEGAHETRIAPLAQAGIAVAEIGEFWAKQPFDLRLPNMNGKTMHGNCDLCFLKGGDQILALIRENPQRAEWWASMEALALALASKPSGAVFRSDRPSYASMYRMATQHGELFPFDDEPLQDCMCTD